MHKTFALILPSLRLNRQNSQSNVRKSRSAEYRRLRSNMRIRLAHRNSASLSGCQVLGIKIIRIQSCLYSYPGFLSLPKIQKVWIKNQSKKIGTSMRDFQWKFSMLKDAIPQIVSQSIALRNSCYARRTVQALECLKKRCLKLKRSV